MLSAEPCPPKFMLSSQFSLPQNVSARGEVAVLRREGFRGPASSRKRGSRPARATGASEGTQPSGPVPAPDPARAALPPAARGASGLPASFLTKLVQRAGKTMDALGVSTGFRTLSHRCALNTVAVHVRVLHPRSLLCGREYLSAATFHSSCLPGRGCYRARGLPVCVIPVRLLCNI